MDQAFAAIWNVLRADDPFRHYANDSELRVTIGQKLMDLVADGVTEFSSASRPHCRVPAWSRALTRRIVHAARPLALCVKLN